MLTNPSLMSFMSASQFHIYLSWGQCLFIMVGTFNQEKALVGAFSVIVKLCVILGNLRLKLYTPGQDGDTGPVGRRHTTSVILPSTVSWLAEHGALSHCHISLHHRDMGARYLHCRISTVSTQGTGWPDASPRDHQLAEVRVDGSMSSAGWSGVEQ